MAAAERARRTAYAPYSRFPVGAALLAADGRLFLGCNVENASFGLSICAERNAVWKAVSEGAREFVAVAVTAGPGRGASPCGACRQVLHEFGPGMVVFWREGAARIVGRPIERLLERAFAFPRRRSR
uniref:Cytidine deaminase n=1 Tax=Eiseniibacteriota bacterium TaxID=2212470 RepID=A0A832MM38_UNCEI